MLFHGHQDSLLVGLKIGVNYRVTGTYIDRFWLVHLQLNSTGINKVQAQAQASIQLEVA